MSTKLGLICFVVLGLFLLLILQLIRVRLRKRYPELFVRLSSPAFQDSNLTKTYWTFHRFVLWGYLSEVNDTILRCLCILASVSQLAGIALFFYVIWLQDFHTL